MAEELPTKEDITLFMRHSERYDNPPDGDYSHLLLTPNGIKESNKTGRSIDRKIGIVKSSPVERCRQTLFEILKFVKKDYLPKENFSSREGIPSSKRFSDLLGDPSPVEQGGVGWYEYYHYLQIHDVGSARGVTLEMEAKKILDAIFEETNEKHSETSEEKLYKKSSSSSAARETSSSNSLSKKEGKLNLICSHDGHVVILASALFNLKTQLKWTKEWCQYAEGIFFYGNRSHFTAIWRNVKKEFINYLM